MVTDIATEDHPQLATIGGHAMINAVQFKLLYSNVAKKPTQLDWALPLSGNIREYPVVGELVCIVFILEYHSIIKG